MKSPTQQTHQLTTSQQRVVELEKDRERLDKLESLIRPAKGYCEVYLSGLRNVVNGDFTDAVAYQIESNPEIFPTFNRPMLRQAIDGIPVPCKTCDGNGIVVIRNAESEDGGNERNVCPDCDGKRMTQTKGE